MNYIVWQNRAVDFYAAGRSLFRQGLMRPSTYCSVICLELLLKATLVYFDRSFVPEDSRHNIRKMLRILKNKGPKDRCVSIPEYFIFENRYLSSSRYPKNPQGILIPASFLPDLDKAFVELLTLVPFQFNSMLISTLSGRSDYKLKLAALKFSNTKMKALRHHLRPWMQQQKKKSAHE